MSEAETFNNQGVSWAKKGEFVKAKYYFTKSLEISPNHNSANNIGVCLAQLGDNHKAIKYFQKAINLNDKFAEGYSNLGNALRLVGHQISAEKMLLKAIAIKKDYEGALLNLALVSEDLGKLTNALLYNEKALVLSPTSSQYTSHIYYLKRKMCDWLDIKAINKKLNLLVTKDLSNNNKSGETPFLNIVRTSNKQINYNVAKSWSDSLTKDSQKKVANKRTGQRQIRVGYISESFRDHPVGHSVSNLFTHHNKKRFKIYAYSYGINDNTSFREEVINSTIFKDIRTCDHNTASQKIHDDQIDLLVDLHGYTKDNRMKILAKKPASIQISYLGFPGTTGAKYMDYIVGDKTIIPTADRKYFSEKIIYLSNGYFIRSNPTFAPKKSKKNFQGEIIFCSFNRSVKITPEIFKTWMQILNCVIPSVLWLYRDNAYAETNLKRIALSCGIDPTRLIFINREEISKHLKRLSQADIALDTSDYSGGATTANCLIAGVPVITLKGRHYLSRMSDSLLRQSNLPDLITDNLKEYKNLAVNLALNKTELDSVASRIQTNNLLDGKKFVSCLENAYEKAWQRHSNNQKPINIFV